MTTVLVSQGWRLADAVAAVEKHRPARGFWDGVSADEMKQLLLDED
jgi:hypothetical protein